MANDGSPIPFEPYFGGFILETLTIGMYGESRNAIREYIQNGFDSIQRAVDMEILSPKDGLIEIELAEDRKSLSIRDNGGGIRANIASEILTRVGASTKDHRRNAGFRGIGRLAGIVFSDTVTFTTKAKGEDEQTTVVIDAKAMRDAMAPDRGSNLSATELLTKTVTVYASKTRRLHKHFFEVRLDGLRRPPEECRSLSAMIGFVSQVAPVPFAEEFPYVGRLQAIAEESGITIDEVSITVRDGRAAPKDVYKPYRGVHRLGSATVPITDCEIFSGDSGTWWGWVGKKLESGAYTDLQVAGLRVRVRNIQIDGTDLVREIFRKKANSHARFQDFFIGEIYVRPGVLIPNARRDGFEEDRAWRKLSREISVVTRNLSTEAYQISRQGKFAVDALKSDVADTKRQFSKHRKSKFADVNRAIVFSKSITTIQGRVAKALLGSTVEAAGQLHVLSSELMDMKRETLSQLGSAALDEDREKLQQETREEMVEEILVLLEDRLSPKCLTEARRILFDEYGIGE